MVSWAVCVIVLFITGMLALAHTPAAEHPHGIATSSPPQQTVYGIQVAYTAEEQYKSQDGQDKWANEHIFRGMTNGQFMDLGCYDGITCERLQMRVYHPCAPVVQSSAHAKRPEDVPHPLGSQTQTRGTLSVCSTGPASASNPTQASSHG